MFKDFPERLELVKEIEIEKELNLSQRTPEAYFSTAVKVEENHQSKSALSCQEEQTALIIPKVYATGVKVCHQKEIYQPEN